MSKSMVCLALLALAGLTAAAQTSTAQTSEHTKDSLESVKKAVGEGKAILLDVREKNEWDAGHLHDAKLLPLSALIKGSIAANELATLIPKGKVVYCHCARGGRALLAADELKKLGVEVRPLKQGYEELLKAGFTPAKN
jgi:rhodanese-related sulfurtransferase